MYLKAVTLKGGSWFGDYQVLLNVKTDWDMIAGTHTPGKEHLRARGLPLNHIMTYQLGAEFFRKAVDDYPTLRSLLIARSLFRRSYFRKSFNDNVQVILFRLKQRQHIKLIEL